MRIVTDTASLFSPEEGRALGVEVIPGVELSAQSDTELHILGYFIDIHNRQLKDAMAYALRGAPSDSRDLYANALCVMLPISVLSCVRYAMSGNLRLDGFTRFAVPALIGGVVGGFLLGRLRVGALKALFAALVIYSGIVLVVR